MNGNAMRVEWDPKDFRQIEQAKSKYREAKSGGRKLFCIDGARPFDAFNANAGGFLIGEVEVGDGKLAARFIDETGDRRLVWDANDPEQVREAMGKFQNYAKRGWRAYGISRNGKRRVRITRFDAGREEIYFSDTGKDGATSPIRKKFRDFAKDFREVKVTPKTYPG